MYSVEISNKAQFKKKAIIESSNMFFFLKLFTFKVFRSKLLGHFHWSDTLYRVRKAQPQTARSNRYWLRNDRTLHRKGKRLYTCQFSCGSYASPMYSRSRSFRRQSRVKVIFRCTSASFNYATLSPRRLPTFTSATAPGHLR